MGQTGGRSRIGNHRGARPGIKTAFTTYTASGAPSSTNMVVIASGAETWVGSKRLADYVREDEMSQAFNFDTSSGMATG